MLTIEQVKNYLDREFIRKLYATTDGIDAKEFRGGTATLEGLVVSGDTVLQNVIVSGDLDVDGDTTLDTVTIDEGLTYGGLQTDIHGLVTGFAPLEFSNGWANRVEGNGSGVFAFVGDLIYLIIDVQSDNATGPVLGTITDTGLLPVFAQFIVGGVVTYKPNGTVSGISPDAVTISPNGEVEIAAIGGLGAGIDYMYSGMYSSLGAA